MSVSLTASRDAAGPTPAGGALARAVAAVPPPGLLLVSIVSIQLGAAVAALEEGSVPR